MDRQTTLSSEEDSNHQSKFNVPSVNLANPFRKEVKNSARPNLGLATKKISQGKKTVRFPASAQSGVLHAAPSVLSAKDLELDTEMYQAPSGPGLRLPSFQITVPIEPQLDSESESLVQKALGNLMKGRTTFVIAHRLSTIGYAHRIVVISDGRIVEEGIHEHLLARQGHYYRLYQMQLADNHVT